MSTVEENNDGTKRKSEGEAEGAAPEKMLKVEDSVEPVKMEKVDDSVEKCSPSKAANTKARDIRLDQNRKAARESRRRKKVMIEELQRSVIFFSRANGTLKQQNDELTRFLMQAQMQIAAIESHAGISAVIKPVAPTEIEDKKPEAQSLMLSTKEDQALANAVATQAMYETKGYPAAAARAAAQAMNGNNVKNEASKDSMAPLSLTPLSLPPVTVTGSQNRPPLPPMQPGATMQAMANFQQAAAAAMQSAIGQMQNLPGVSIQQLAAAPAGTNAQQAYTDTMTALAMQQAAAAAAAGMIPQHMQFFSFIPHWQHQQPAQKPDPPSGNQNQMSKDYTV